MYLISKLTTKAEEKKGKNHRRIQMKRNRESREKLEGRTERDDS